MTTKSNYYASIANKDINKDYYDNDAIAINDIKIGEPSYYKFYEAAESPRLAYEKYKSIYPAYKTNSNFHFNTANYFINSLKSKEYGLKILLNLERYANNNPEVLKAIAYK